MTVRAGSRPALPRAVRPLVRYPLIAGTLAIGVAVAVLWSAGSARGATILGGGFALAVAAGYAVRMVRRLVHGRVGVDLLAVVAIVATTLVGEIAAALVVVLMLSGGEALEQSADRRARRELDALLDREPRIAHRVAEDVIDEDSIDDVPIGDIVPGDRLLVRPAEVVPVDATLVSAAGAFDLSSITGESLPVDRRAGDAVPSGSINGTLAVQVRATALAADSQYQQIVALVAQAEQGKAEVVRVADRFAVPFTVFSLLLAGVAWAVSGHAVRFAEVLVLATPCPLLIAAPVAFIGGMSSAARRGIIVRNGSVFERLARARTIVFDKTGTLTRGRPVLEEVRPAGGMDAATLLGLSASAERYSSHVLAASVVQEAISRGIPLRPATDAKEHATEGLRARVGDRLVEIGTAAFVGSCTGSAVHEDAPAGRSVVYVAIDGRYAGALIERDIPRVDARETLLRLRGLGLSAIEMLTGDARATAAAIAAEVGIERYTAECLPADKVSRVAAISERPVIMVGDGVNDAPVLARADVGIAMGARGATAASESADVVLLADDLALVADAVALGRRTVSIALQSIWMGMAASVGLMIVAAFGLIPALVGAVLQEVVDLVTIVAALRSARDVKG
ncbi:cobalt ABC transporter ATP-binding protein [Leifsonia sp. LS1]|uniref:heavy metal translocating P-type ATPase n=1 Tax=Leifsonia sp. LS1 TaxID=2828483 RepID=UPI001CFF129B|nr:heavy metal translocating P-type ATPase [Leifsonia sp. LS1]GIT81784.1 cobalt ABC transporter ATP-binding protein [Leifsonia sp. LS1]